MSLKRNIQVLAAVAAVFAFSAIAVGVAQAAGDAPRLTVAGKTPAFNEFFSFTGTSTGSEDILMEQAKEVGKLEVPGLFTLTNPKGKCTITGSFAGSAANTSGTAKEVQLTCTEVDMEFQPQCIVESEPLNVPGTIQTAKLKGVSEWLGATGDGIGITFTHEFVTESFMAITVTGEGCVFKGLTVKVEGSIVGEVETPGTDKETQALSFPTPPITESWSNATPRAQTPGLDELRVGGKAATFTNTFDLTLTSKALWGVETG
jgi:hypothetical protein